MKRLAKQNHPDRMKDARTRRRPRAAWPPSMRPGRCSARPFASLSSSPGRSPAPRLAGLALPRSPAVPPARAAVRSRSTRITPPPRTLRRRPPLPMSHADFGDHAGRGSARTAQVTSSVSGKQARRTTQAQPHLGLEPRNPRLFAQARGRPPPPHPPHPLRLPPRARATVLGQAITAVPPAVMRASMPHEAQRQHVIGDVADAKPLSPMRNRGRTA